MKKKGITVCVLVVIMVMSVVGYNYCQNLITTPTEAEDKNKLELEPKGTYVITAFGEEFFVYLFDEPNSNIVVFETLDGIYMVAQYNGEKGTSYGNIFRPEGKFIALSNEYLLFDVEGKKLAVSIEKKKNVKSGDNLYDEYWFDELSKEVQETFIYPVECREINR